MSEIDIEQYKITEEPFYQPSGNEIDPVSYTHLTLPTTSRV